MTEAALIAAIHAQPDEDTPRLMYADWLDENGTTDQHAARSEWVRMTCDDRSKRAQKPTGKRVRKPGEVPWLKANWRRLWPAIAKAIGDIYHPVSLNTGGFVFRVPVTARTELTDTAYLDFSHIVLRAERGVATLGYVTFLRGAVTAPLLAADEPFVPIQFGSEPDRVFEFSSERVYVMRRPFVRRGLLEVWNRIPLPQSAPVDEAERGKWAKQPNVVYNTDHIRPLIYKALTEWAREQVK